MKMVLNYPVSLSVIRKLKAGDVVHYNGKIVVVEKSLIDTILNYEKSEGIKLYDLTGEIVVFGFFEKNRLVYQEVDPDSLSTAFVLGVVGVVVEKNPPLEDVIVKFARVVFKPEEELKGKRNLVFKTPDGRKVEELEVTNLILRVLQDASGKSLP